MYDYDSNESYGWYAEPLIKKLSPSMYPEMNGRPGYWAEDILRESAPTMFGEDNDSHNESDYSENGGDEGGGYYAMDILAVQMPGLYGDHGESGWYNEDIWRQL